MIDELGQADDVAARKLGTSEVIERLRKKGGEALSLDDCDLLLAELDRLYAQNALERKWRADEMLKLRERAEKAEAQRKRWKESATHEWELEHAAIRELDVARAELAEVRARLVKTEAQRLSWKASAMQERLAAIDMAIRDLHGKTKAKAVAPPARVGFPHDGGGPRACVPEQPPPKVSSAMTKEQAIKVLKLGRERIWAGAMGLFCAVFVDFPPVYGRKPSSVGSSKSHRQDREAYRRRPGRLVQAPAPRRHRHGDSRPPGKEEAMIDRAVLLSLYVLTAVALLALVGQVSTGAVIALLVDVVLLHVLEVLVRYRQREELSALFWSKYRGEILAALAVDEIREKIVAEQGDVADGMDRLRFIAKMVEKNGKAGAWAWDGDKRSLKNSLASSRLRIRKLRAWSKTLRSKTL